MTQTMGVWTVALGSLSGCLSTITSDSIDRHSIAKNEKEKQTRKQTNKQKPKQTQQLYKYVFFPEGSKYTRKCSMYRYCTR